MSEHEKSRLKRKFRRFIKNIKRRKRQLIIPVLIIIIAIASCIIFGPSLFSKKGPEVTEYATDGSKGDVVEKTLSLEGKTCVCFGDSITGNTDPPYDYPSVIAKQTGMEVINMGFGGTRMSNHPYPEYDAFSMFRLADAIATNDYSLQEAYKYNEEIGSVATKRLKAIYKIDWTEVDFITIFYGANDIKNSGNELDDPEDPLNTSTFLGAMRYTINRIRSAYPDIKIVILSPIYRYWTETGENSDEQILRDIPYTGWVDAVITTANEYDAFCIDLYHLTGFNSSNLKIYYQDDGIHPNYDGLSIIGTTIANKMISHYAPKKIE